MFEVSAANQIGFVLGLEQESNFSGSVFDNRDSFPGHIAEAEVFVVEKSFLFSELNLNPVRQGNDRRNRFNRRGNLSRWGRLFRVPGLEPENDAGGYDHHGEYTSDSAQLCGGNERPFRRRCCGYA